MSLNERYYMPIKSGHGCDPSYMTLLAFTLTSCRGIFDSH